jgi:hypothetical protein
MCLYYLTIINIMPTHISEALMCISDAVGILTEVRRGRGKCWNTTAIKPLPVPSKSSHFLVCLSSIAWHKSVSILEASLNSPRKKVVRPNKLTQVLTLLTSIREMRGSNPAENRYPNWGLRDFTQLLKGDSGILYQCRLRLPPSVTFPIHCSLIILPYDRYCVTWATDSAV